MFPFLLLLMLLGEQAFAADCTASYTYTANGGSSTYTLSAGQSLKIASGTFTGYIDALPGGSSICVETGATFTPGGFNNISGTLTNYGTSTLQNYTYNTGTAINNHGTLTLNGLNTNGAMTFTNQAGATMNIPYSFQLGMNSTMTNDGLLVAGQDFNTENGTTLTNNYRMEVEGNFNPDGVFNNYGRVYAKQFMNINANSDVTNYCTLVSWGGFNNNSPLMDNRGTILITTSTGTPGGPWQNNVPFNNASGAKIAGGDFTNDAAFSGGGFMIFSGTTRNNGTFTGNSAADKITFYDETQTGSQIFDIEGVAPTNTVRAAFTRPTELDAPTTCTTSYKNFANPVTSDFGDAPATYGDASHTIVSGIHLGALEPDAEAASQPTFNALGDGADEDGAPHPVSPAGPTTAALFPVLKITATSYTLPVTVTNTTGTAGKVYGWIDFDKNGTFEADEGVSATVANGTNNAAVNLVWSSIPTDIKLGTTFIRLRLTTDTAATTSTPTGSASNGEVEDYPLAIYQQVPANSNTLSIVTGASPLACQTKIFEDNFDDVAYISWGANRPGSQSIRDWVRGGGGSDTYAEVEYIDATQQMAVYFGTGSVRGISPSIPSGFTFDANGKLTSPLDAIALRDTPDDVSTLAAEAIWGPHPVTLSRSFPTQIGKTYRVYFKAIPEKNSSYVFGSGIMRVDIGGSSTESIHFKAPGSTEGAQDYAIEFTATATTSTLTFVNYGHVGDGWCDPQIEAWCTMGGTTDGSTTNELIIDDVVLAEANCNNGTISGTVYTDENGNNTYDTASESGISSITVTLKNNSTGVTIATTITAADGSYSFTDLDSTLTYRLDVDTTDSDLAGKIIGTTNPLAGITVTAGGTTANQNFGFDLPKDYSDAPASYGSPSHLISTGIKLGSNAPDAEASPLPSVGADADDNTGTDDEDGITIPALVQNQTVSITATVSGAGGYLQGWIDWNGDGDFADSGEQVATNIQDNGASDTNNTAGIIAFNVIVPATASTSQTYARFRWSTTPALTSSNAANDGEVEDYVITVNPSCSLLVTTTADSDNAFNSSGSLRDAIECANSTPGADTITFNIPKTDSGFLNTDGIANNGDEYWRITLNSALPALTESVSIDGSTQTFNQGNTNSGDLAAATIVGTNSLSLAGVNAPEVEVLGQTSFPAGFDIRAGNVGIYSLSIRRFGTDIRVSQANSNGILLVGLAMGVNTVSGNDPGAGARSSQHLAVDASNTSVILANSVLGYNDSLRSIVTGQNAALTDVTLTISGNHFVSNGMAGNTNNGAVEILRTQNPDVLIAGNRFTGRGKGVASDFAIEFNDTSGTDVTCSSCLINNNDISGYRDGIGYQGSAKMTGLEITSNRIHDNTATAIVTGNAQNAVISENHLYGNGGSGIVISNNSAAGNIITRNRTYNNGKLGIDLVGGTEAGTGGVTLNDANDTDSGPNNLLNFPPMLQIVKSSTGNLIIRGCAAPGAAVELFEADVSTGGAASSGANRFGLTEDYGEGQTYLGSMVEGTAADMDAGSCSIPGEDGNVHTGMNAFQFSIATPASVSVGDYLTATATVSGSGTSEFSPTVRVDDAPPSVGGGDCAATGGSDILFIVDNSGSITTAEYTDFQQTIGKVGSQLLADNPANRIAIAHFGGPSDTLISGGQYVYFERDFSSNPMIAPVRKFGTAGTYNSAWYADHLAGALQQIRYGLDGNGTTTSRYIVSPLKETSRNLATPLQIVLMTDAARYYDGTPWDISMLIDPVGSGAEPNDSSNFTVYNELKAEGVAFSVVSFNPNATDIATSAAIASVGGAYNGNIEANPSDPEGSQTKPRRYVSITSGFQLTTDQIIEISDGTAICNSAVSGTIFEDVNYGGGAGRPFGTAGTVGVMGASIEFYDNAGVYLGTTVSSASGSYRFNLPDADYYVRVVSDTVNSSRSGSNGSEIPVLTYRSDGVTETTNEIGGRNPSAPSAGSNAGASTLNTGTFAFTGGTLNGKQAHAVQKISLAGDSIKNANFGFNFDTVVNANDAGYGSLRQFLLNANLLGNDASLTQVGQPAGKENAILKLLTSDPNYTGQYWSIPLQSMLPTITSAITLDSSQQTGFTNDPLIELNGLNAGFATNGLTLGAGSDGSIIRNLAINRCSGNGIQVTDSGSHNIQGNRIGTNPDGSVALGNSRTGILLANSANNMIGGTNTTDANLIAHNGFDGIAITGNTSLSNSLLGNSIFDNGGLGIDLADNGVSSNDPGDADSGPNALLNYPLAEENAFAANGTRIVTYDIDIDVPAGEYRLELFSSSAADPSGNGEGQSFLGYKDIVHPGLGSVNYKGTLNANQTVASGTFISATLTRKTIAGTFAETSEFSGIRDSIPTVVCDDLVTGTGGDMMIDENSSTITLLEATDGYGNPVSYVISGGTDSNLFTVKTPTPGATINCTAIQFLTPTVTKSAPTFRAITPPGFLPAGNYEVPADSNGDNVYEVQITAKYSNGNQYTRELLVRIMDVNEAPRILSAAAASVQEDTTAQALNINAVDEDEGSVEDKGITYDISGGTDAGQFEVAADTGIISFMATPDYDAPVDTNKDNVYEVEVTAADSGGLTATKTFSITVTNRTIDDGVKLNIRAMLQGAYDSSTGLMGNEIAALGLLPSSQPYGAAPFGYSGTETLGSLPMNNTGNDAVVDWLLVDIRTSNADIAGTRALLLQRDGDIIDAQSGSTTLHFAGISAGNYYVSVRHRNHLGVMTASPISLNNTEKRVDFSLAATTVSGENARYTSGSLALMWTGDINGSGTLTSSGPGNDITTMLGKVITSTSNPNAYTNYSLQGYLPSDLNMDGKTLFSGPNNDANVLIGNIIMHPLNSNFAANYIVRGGL